MFLKGCMVGIQGKCKAGFMYTTLAKLKQVEKVRKEMMISASSI